MRLTRPAVGYRAQVARSAAAAANLDRPADVALAFYVADDAADPDNARAAYFETLPREFDELPRRWPAAELDALLGGSPARRAADDARAATRLAFDAVVARAGPRWPSFEAHVLPGGSSLDASRRRRGRDVDVSLMHRDDAAAATRIFL